MVQAVKQLQGGVSFDQPTKRWWLKGGAGAAKDFIDRLRSLDFTFSEAEVEAFLHQTQVISTRPCPPCPSNAFAKAFDAFADEEAELDKLLSSGLLDEIEEREACRELRPSQVPELPELSDLPSGGHCTALVNETCHTVTAVRPGLAVKIGGLTSHPELNGCVGIVDQRDNQGSQPSQTQVRWLVTVHCHQYSLAEDKLQVEPSPVGPVGPVQVPPATSGTPGTPEAANSNRLESNANEALISALGETPSGDRPQSDPPQSTIQEAVVIDLETVPEPRRESPAQEPRTRACAICMEEKASTELTVFVPCGHMAACLTCGQRLFKQPCPVCRKKIKRVQQIFLAV